MLDAINGFLRTYFGPWSISAPMPQPLYLSSRKPMGIIISALLPLFYPMVVLWSSLGIRKNIAGLALGDLICLR